MTNDLPAAHTRQTWTFMLTGMALGILVNLPFYAWIFDKDWPWIEGFPVGWLSRGLVYMGTFFHELGHTVSAWFYGYATLPSFDFQHGGGMAWMLSDQEILIYGAFWILLILGIFYFKEDRGLQILFGFALFLNLLFVFTPHHKSVIDFAGPAAEPLIAAFFLYRAWLNLAPRGALERFLNAFFGFGLLFQVFVNGYGLLKSQAYRLVYYEQKGTHGFGDFDKIAGRTEFLTFEMLIYMWLGLAFVCLIIPFFIYLFLQKNIENHNI